MRMQVQSPNRLGPGESEREEEGLFKGETVPRPAHRNSEPGEW